MFFFLFNTYIFRTFLFRIPNNVLNENTSDDLYKIIDYSAFLPGRVSKMYKTSMIRLANGIEPSEQTNKHFKD